MDGVGDGLFGSLVFLEQIISLACQFGGLNWVR